MEEQSVTIGIAFAIAAIISAVIVTASVLTWVLISFT